MSSLKLADIVTLSRVVLAVIVIGILNQENLRLLAFFLTAIIIWMDGLDGYIARKLNQANKFGASLDIVCDRIIEMIYWVGFSSFNWVSLWVPIIFLIRGNFVDNIRAFAQSEGYTAFGEKTMMVNPVAKFLVASNFSRFTYAITKALAFCMIIAAHCSNFSNFNLNHINSLAQVLVYIATAFCLLRGIPVLIEGSRFLHD